MQAVLTRYPWSQEAGASGTGAQGRPTLLTATAVESVSVRGGEGSIPLLAGLVDTESGTRRRWELPASSSLATGELETWPLVLRGHRFGAIEAEIEVGTAGGSCGLGTADYELALGRHVESVYEASGQGEPGRRPEGRSVTTLDDFVDLYSKADEVRDARLALIVRIARAMDATLRELAERPRHVLRRVRRKERVDRARQLDPACIRWLVRQPGRRLEQRAGPRQRVLAVAREQSRSTLENRVLVDFLERCRREAASYLAENAAFGVSGRVRDVQRLSRACGRARVGPMLADVTPARGHVQPNYVLLHDRRYRQLWKWYVALRRKQEEQDRLWRWRNRAIAEVGSIACMAAVRRMSLAFGVPRAYAGEVLALGEQQHGHLLDERSDVVPVPYRRGGSIGEVSVVPACRLSSWQEATQCSGLAALAPDFLLVAHPVGDPTHPRRLAAFWFLPEVRRTCEASVQRAMDGVALEGCHLTPVLVCPTVSETGRDRHARDLARLVRKPETYVLELPLKFSAATQFFTDWLGRWLKRA